MNLTLQIPKEEELNEAERKAHNAAIFAVIPRLEKDIKDKMYEELIKTYSENVGMAKTREEILLATTRGNGIMEGMAILLEMWQNDAKTHKAEHLPEEDFDKHEVIGR